MIIFQHVESQTFGERPPGSSSQASLIANTNQFFIEDN